MNIHEISIVASDITKDMSEAIVNAANVSLLGGGGVDGAIHRAAGPELLKVCRNIPLLPDSTYARIRVGEAVLTHGFGLPAKYIIHTVGPDCRDAGQRANRRRLLGECLRSVMRIVNIKGINSVAFPMISTGIYGFDMAEAAHAMFECFEEISTHAQVKICCFDEGSARTVENAY